ncbi:MerR family transcriptional regulator, partial [Patescibacteria group bacterium]|nr:MerR family transcriptional regulator [Patescibacteria group bacterium]
MNLPAQNNIQENTDSKYKFHQNNFLRVSQAAKILGVSSSTLRRFEEEGLISSYRDPGNNYRFYRLDVIKDLKKDIEEKKSQSKNSINLEQSIYKGKTKKARQKISVIDNNEKKNIDLKKDKQAEKIKDVKKSENKDAKIKANEKLSLPIITNKELRNEEKQKIFSNRQQIANQISKESKTYNDNISGESFFDKFSDNSSKLNFSLNKQIKRGLILFIASSLVLIGTVFISSSDILTNKINSYPFSSILGSKSTNNKIDVGVQDNADIRIAGVLAARTRVSDFIQNFNLPTFFKEKSTFEAGLDVNELTFIDTATMNNLLGIDDVTTTTLEEALGIDGEVVGTNMRNTVIAEGVIDGTKLAPVISYSGNFDFLNNSLSLDGVTIEATGEEINILSGLSATTDEINILSGLSATTQEINYLSGLAVTTGGILFGDGGVITQ